MFDVSQYGVSPSPVMSGLSTLAGAIPVIGPLLAGGMNMLSQHLQNKKQEEFYNKYQSPQARMAQMRAAGINPNAAAQGISGAAAPQMNAAAPTSAFSSLGEALGQSVNTSLTAGAIKAQTENVEAQTEGQRIENRFQNETFDDRAAYLRNEGLISAEEYNQAAELSRQYPELLNQTIEQMRSNIRKNDAQVKVFDQQIDNLKKEIDKMEEEIRKMKSDETLNYAMAGENNARAELERAEKALTDKKAELAQVEKNKAELGADSNVELKYREIEKKEGTAAADKWLDSQYKVVNKIEQGVQDANVMTAEQRKIVESYDKQIAQAEKYLDECTQKYYNAGSTRKSWHKGAMEQAQNKVNNLRKQKAEQLRRLGINESTTNKVGPVSTSRSK